LEELSAVESVTVGRMAGIVGFFHLFPDIGHFLRLLFYTGF
jgi:hypothetical protein